MTDANTIIKQAEKNVNSELILSSANEKLQKEKTKKLSKKEAVFSSVMAGIADSYIIPFAIALNASNFQIGLTSAFANFAGPIAQLKGSRLIERNSRVKLIANYVAWQAFIFLPIALISIFFMSNLFIAHLPLTLIIFYALYAITGALAGPAWFSLMGDVVDDKERGRYFSTRSRMASIAALLAVLTASFILDFFKTKGYLLIGFSIIFLIAGISRFITVSLFRKHYEPKLEFPKEYYFSFRQFVRKARHNNFGRFAIFVALIHAMTAIAGPFFAVYMLRQDQLALSYVWFMLITISASLTAFLISPLWGRLSDKLGNRKLLKLGTIIVCIVPILWLFSRNPLYLMLVPNALGGIGWAAFNLAASNFIYDAVTPARRGIIVAYYNILIGIGTFIGASAGGLITQYAEISFMNIFLFVFLVSGIARIFVSAVMLPRIKEVRKISINPAH